MTGAVRVIAEMQDAYPTIERLFADGGYAGVIFELAMLNMDGAKIEVVKWRRVVERIFAWLGRCRRLAKDGQKTIASSEPWMLIASIRRTSRKRAELRYDC